MRQLFELAQKLGRKLRIALVCRGGPENGPFSAMVGRILSEELLNTDIDIQAIYASSGSDPTALLGCTGDWAKLCDVWANLTPEKIVGEVSKLKTTLRMVKSDLAYAVEGEPIYESFLDNTALRNLIAQNWDLKKIGSPEALDIKFPAVDLCSNEYIIFSNRVPGHLKWFTEGVLGSMGLVPFLPPQRVFNPEEAGLIEKGKAKNNSLLLVDGGFMGNMLLEEAMRDWFDVIFLIDIHGLKVTESNFDINKKYHWSKLLRTGFHVLSSTNDFRQYQMDERINEEIRIKGRLEEFLKTLPLELSNGLTDILKQMNEGRLRLGDKKETKIIVVSNEKHSTLFNFASFTKHKETIQLLTAGYEAAHKTLEELGFL